MFKPTSSSHCPCRLWIKSAMSSESSPNWAWVAVFSLPWAFLPNLALLTSAFLLCRAGGGLRFIPAVQCKCLWYHIPSFIGFLHKISSFSFWSKCFWWVNFLPSWLTNQHQQHKQDQIWKLFSSYEHFFSAPSFETRKIKQWIMGTFLGHRISTWNPCTPRCFHRCASSIFATLAEMPGSLGKECQSCAKMDIHRRN